MRLELLTTTSLLTLALARPSTLSPRDKFDKCSVFGANCAVQDQSFCDANTGKISICHQFGSDCWVRYTQDTCTGKRSDMDKAAEGKRDAEVEAEEVKMDMSMAKRDRFDKCAVFGSACTTDGNTFCDASTGNLSTCHKVPFSSECWVRYTQTPCAGKRDGSSSSTTSTSAEEAGQVKREAEVETAMEKRDRFDKCSVFGSNCAVDGNTFCLDGRKSVCHKLPFTNDCWVRYTASSC